MKKSTYILLWVLFLALVVCASANTQEKAKVDFGESASKIQGTLELAGLQKPVNVMRDKWGVAHIYAQNQHDLFFAQGFVAAQDRLFQMELWKRSGQGRLAEVIGPSGLYRDINARLLRYRGDQKADYESYSPDTYEILEAFTSGINANIAQRTAPGGQGLQAGFKLAGFKPEPWKPQDCLNRMAAFSMTGNAVSELEHAEMVNLVGAAEASKLLDLDPKVELDPAPGLDLTGLAPGLLSNLIGSDTRIPVPTYYVEGSNDWTVSGSLTASGKPMMANDPHRVMAVPSLRYMVHLVAPGWDVIGAGEPGLPGVALGHNEHIAWGFTIFGSDQQDLYVEELNPSDPLEYKTPKGWEKMEVQRETFRVRGNSPVTVDLRFTRHGPVLWDNGKRALALRWVGMEPGTAGYLSSLAVDRSENWEQFTKAMDRWKVPSENIVYADTAGNIGEYSVGLSPIRKNWKGLLPVPGNGGYEWSGFIPTKDLPHTYNPPAGFFATANNKTTVEPYPYNISFEWYSRYRVMRINDVLGGYKESGHKITVEDFEKLQVDDVSLPAIEVVKLLKTAAGNDPTADEQMLLNWKGDVDKDSAAAVLYEIYREDLTKAVVHKIAPPSLGHAWRGFTEYQMLQVLEHPGNWPAFGSDAEGARNQLLRDAMVSAVKRLSALEGPDPTKWTWGQIHVAVFRHSLSPRIKDLGPVARSGDGETVGATGFYGDTYEQIAGASYREIMDTSDWDNSVAVNVPGQSGEPGSPHYSDLLPLWSEGKYFPLRYSEAAVKEVTTDKLELQP